MTNQDRKAFAALMIALSETFNEPVSDIRIEAYFDALSDLECAEVLAAGHWAIAECRFFPRPVELREIARGSENDQAETAWDEMRRLVRSVGYMGIDGRGTPPEFSSEPMRRAALELYGGWVALCSNLPNGRDDTAPAFLGARKAFIASYKAYAGVQKREHLKLPAHLLRELGDGRRH